MRVRVHAPAFCDHSALDGEGYLELAEGAGLKEVFRRLRINPLVGALLLCTVNYERAKPGTRLAEGDVVSFLPFVGGG